MLGAFRLLIGGTVAFFCATALFWAGIVFEHRPAGWPNIKVAFWHIRLPDGPWARLKAIDALAATQAAHNRVVTVQRAQVSEAIGLGEAKAQETIRVVYRTIHDQVTTYVPTAADTACVVPLGLVRIHDAGARGVPPVPLSPGESYDAPSGLKLSSVVETVIGNYGAANANAEQLAALQQWVRVQSTIK